MYNAKYTIFYSNIYVNQKPVLLIQLKKCCSVYIYVYLSNFDIHI